VTDDSDQLAATDRQTDRCESSVAIVTLRQIVYFEQHPVELMRSHHMAVRKGVDEQCTEPVDATARQVNQRYSSFTRTMTRMMTTRR
jgi:hypothetical protein